MDDNEYVLNREVRMLNNDKKMTERAVESEKNRWAELLKGEMGNDINDVLSGKVKIKPINKKSFKYKLKKFFRIK